MTHIAKFSIFGFGTVIAAFIFSVANIPGMNTKTPSSGALAWNEPKEDTMSCPFSGETSELDAALRDAPTADVATEAASETTATPAATAATATSSRKQMK